MSITQCRFLLELALACLLLVCAGNVAALGNAGDKFFIQDSVAQATWVQQDGCVLTTVSVFYSDQVVRQVGSGTVESPANLFAFVVRQDECSGTLSASGGQGTGALTILGGLHEARLTGTVLGQAEGTGAPAELAIDLTFIASGEMMRSLSIINFTFGGHLFLSRNTVKAQSREAVATGSVKLNGIETLTGPSTDGLVLTDAQGSFQKGF